MTTTIDAAALSSLTDAQIEEAHAALAQGYAGLPAIVAAWRPRLLSHQATMLGVVVRALQDSMLSESIALRTEMDRRHGAPALPVRMDHG